MSVEGEVKQQHIHARLAQKAEKSAFGIVLDELADAIFGQVRALAMRGTWNSSASGECPGQAARRCRDQIGWNGRRGVLLLQRLDVSLDAIDERLVGGPRFEPPDSRHYTGRGWSWSRLWDRARSSPTGVREESLVAREHLADQLGADDLAVALVQAPLRLAGKIHPAMPVIASG